MIKPKNYLDDTREVRSALDDWDNVYLVFDEVPDSSNTAPDVEDDKDVASDDE